MYGPERGPYDYGRGTGPDYGGYDKPYGRYYEREQSFPFLAFRIIGYTLLATALLILVLDITRMAYLTQYFADSGLNLKSIQHLLYIGGPSIGSFITVVIPGALGAAISPYRRIGTVKSLKIGFLVLAILNMVLFLPTFIALDSVIVGAYSIVDLKTGLNEFDIWLALTATLVALNCLAWIVCLAGSIMCCVAHSGPYPRDMKQPKDPYWRDPRYEPYRGDPYRGNDNYEPYRGNDNYGYNMSSRYASTTPREKQYMGPPPSYHTNGYSLPRPTRW